MPKTKTYWKTTPKARFLCWKKYKNLVDREVKRLEKAFTIETNPTLKEECRNVLNEFYHTQYELTTNMI